MKWLFILSILSLPLSTHAFTWSDLWSTKDQQATALLKQGHFAEAKQRFQRDDWRATAAYRAGLYDDAATTFRSLNNDDGYYNQGNALAHMGQYEQAIKAYDQALNQNPNHQDARYNRDLIKRLLNQDQQQNQQPDQDQQKQDQQKQDQQKQDQQKQDQQKQDQQKQDQQKQDQQKQDQQKQDQQKQDQQKQDQQKQDQQKQDQQKQDQQKQDQQKQDQQKQDQQKQDQQKQDQQKQDQQKQDQQKLDKQKKDKQKKDQQKQPNLNKNGMNAQPSQQEQEKQHAKEQWLQLIPDDPGGLLREKFLRDHLRRQNGWDQ